MQVAGVCGFGAGVQALGCASDLEPCVHGELCMASCAWWAAHGELHMVSWAWWTVHEAVSAQLHSTPVIAQHPAWSGHGGDKFAYLL